MPQQPGLLTFAACGCRQVTKADQRKWKIDSRRSFFEVVALRHTFTNHSKLLIPSTHSHRLHNSATINHLASPDLLDPSSPIARSFLSSSFSSEENNSSTVGYVAVEPPPAPSLQWIGCGGLLGAFLPAVLYVHVHQLYLHFYY